MLILGVNSDGNSCGPHSGSDAPRTVHPPFPPWQPRTGDFSPFRSDRDVCAAPAGTEAACVYISVATMQSISLPRNSLAAAQTIYFKIKITAATSGLLLLSRPMEKQGLF